MTPRASAVAVAFVANGLGGPSFLPRLPERQASLGLSDAGLGVVLVGMAAGALVASPVAGRLVGRLGSRRVVVVSALVLAASLWTAGAAPEPLALFAALCVIGAADAAMDIAMNANGAAYERRAGRSVMHRLHGAWSLGALGAAGVSLTWQLAAVGAVIAVAVASTRSGLVADGALPPSGTAPAVGRPTATEDLLGDAANPSSAGGTTRSRLRPRVGPLVVLGAATVGGAVIEGAPADWSAIRLERLGAGPGAAALGFAAFMAGMLAARAVGDHATDRLGGTAVLRGGMGLVAAGLLAGALVDHPAVFALGLVLAGLGASAFFPLAFSAAGNTPGVAPGAGAATVSLSARLGFLLEPLAMGVLAEMVGLRWAFVAVAAIAVGLAAAAGRIVPPTTRALDAATITDMRAG